MGGFGDWPSGAGRVDLRLRSAGLGDCAGVLKFKFFENNRDAPSAERGMPCTAWG